MGFVWRGLFSQRVNQPMNPNLCKATLELEVDVTYVYHPAIPGARDCGSGLQVEPDEREYVEIWSVCYKGQPLNLNKDQIAALESRCLEDYQDLQSD
jgi:hypothetical protein